MPATSPEYRQLTRQNYIASTRRDGGFHHLWHISRIAHIRFSPSKGIQDAPEVDFRNPESNDDIRYSTLVDRYERDVRVAEKAIRAGNRTLLRHLLEANDSRKREQRHLNQFPTPQEVAQFDVAHDHVRARDRARQTKFKAMSKGNALLLRHLIETKPGTRTAKSLDTWYHTVHKKRLKQLSRFRPDEPFVGADVLVKECKVHPLIGSGRNCGAAARSALDDPVMAVQYPLIEGHPHPPPPIGDVISTAPRMLLPALTATTYGQPGLTMSNSGIREHKVVAKPEWQSIAATDVPLMHYASDRALTDASRIVCAEEEGGCTRLWRHSVRAQRLRYEVQKAAEERSVSTMKATDEARHGSMSEQQLLQAERRRSRWSSAGARSRSLSPKASFKWRQTWAAGAAPTLGSMNNVSGFAGNAASNDDDGASGHRGVDDGANYRSGSDAPFLATTTTGVTGGASSLSTTAIPLAPHSPPPTSSNTSTQLSGAPFETTMNDHTTTSTVPRHHHYDDKGQPFTCEEEEEGCAARTVKIPTPPQRQQQQQQPDETAYDAMMKEWTRASKASRTRCYIAL